MILGLSFILLLERGPGREHIAIQSYMLALVAALGALYALALAVEPLREFFELTQLGGGQLFLALLSAAGGLVLASAVWRLPAIERLEEDPALARGRAHAASRPSAGRPRWRRRHPRHRRHARRHQLPARARLVPGLPPARRIVPVWRIHRAIGMGGDQLVAALAGDEVEEEKGDEIRAAEKPLYMAMIEEVEPFEGAQGAARASSPSAAHRSSSPPRPRRTRSTTTWTCSTRASWSTGWTTSADVEETKPEPDLVEAALEKAGTREAVMVGDSVWDCEAAKRAGIATVAVLSGGYAEAELAAAGAREVFESVEDAARASPSRLGRGALMRAAEPGPAPTTKIVATVGPASREPEMLRELIEAGVDVFRLNFSHGTADEHAENVDPDPGGRRGARARGRHPRRPARAEAAARAISRATSRCSTRARSVVLDGRRRRARPATPSASRSSGPAIAHGGRSRATRSSSPTAACASRSPRSPATRSSARSRPAARSARTRA